MSTTVASKARSSIWDAQFEALRTRFPKAKDSILFCIHALQQDSNVVLAQLKGLAQMHGIRITAGSLASARRKVAPRVAESPVEKPKAVTVARQEPRTPVAVRAPHGGGQVRVGAAVANDDLAEMLLQVVGRATVEADAKPERLRGAVLKAIEVLRKALEGEKKVTLP